jgi:hypothetical protein
MLMFQKYKIIMKVLCFNFEVLINVTNKLFLVLYTTNIKT